jgi:hypothetical protein
MPRPHHHHRRIRLVAVLGLAVALIAPTTGLGAQPASAGPTLDEVARWGFEQLRTCPLPTEVGPTDDTAGAPSRCTWRVDSNVTMRCEQWGHETCRRPYDADLGLQPGNIEDPAATSTYQDPPQIVGSSVANCTGSDATHVRDETSTVARETATERLWSVAVDFKLTSLVTFGAGYTFQRTESAFDATESVRSNTFRLDVPGWNESAMARRVFWTSQRGSWVLEYPNGITTPTGDIVNEVIVPDTTFYPSNFDPHTSRPRSFTTMELLPMTPAAVAACGAAAGERLTNQFATDMTQKVSCFVAPAGTTAAEARPCVSALDETVVLQSVVDGAIGASATVRILDVRQETCLDLSGTTLVTPSMQPCLDATVSQLWRKRPLPGTDQFLLENADAAVCLTARDAQYRWDDQRFQIAAVPCVAASTTQQWRLGTGGYSIAPEAPQLVDSLPAATVGQPYDVDLVGGGRPRPSVYVLDGAALPPGLWLDHRGHLIGTPLQGGGFELPVICAANGIGDPACRSLRLDILAPPTFGPLVPAIGFVGGAYRFDVPVSGFPAPTLSAEGLPPGLSIDGTAITGTPTAIGRSTVHLHATNSVGSTTAAVVIDIRRAGTCGWDSYDADGWSSAHLTDGITTSEPGRLGYVTDPNNTSNRRRTCVIVDLGASARLDSVVMFPAVVDGRAVGMPIDYVLEASSDIDFPADGTTVIASRAGITGGGEPRSHPVDDGAPSARYVRLTVTRPGELWRSGYYGLALAELQIVRRDVGPRPQPTCNQGLENANWGVAKVTDGSTRYDNGYHGQTGNYDRWKPECVTIDLGENTSIDSVTLSGSGTTGYATNFGFPKQFVIEASTQPDFAAGSTTVIATETDGHQPFDYGRRTGGTVPYWALEPTTARYVRVTATELSETGSGQFALVLSEIGVNVDVTPKFVSGALPYGVVGVPYNFQVVATGRPRPTFTATGLPPGLTIDAATGVVSGTPTVAGAFAVAVVAVGAGSAVQRTTVVIAPRPVTIAPQLHNGTVGAAYSAEVWIDGDPAAVDVIGLPPGLRFDLAAGAVVGAPTTAGSYDVTFTARDSAGVTTTATGSITVYPQPVCNDQESVSASDDWGVKRLTDPLFATGPGSASGYSGKLTTDEYEPECVIVSWGRWQTMSSIRLYGMAGRYRWNDGDGFPVDFRIDVSSDPSFATFTTVATVTDADAPDAYYIASTVPLAAQAEPWLFLRLTATRLGHVRAPNYRLVLARVFGTPTTASPLFQLRGQPPQATVGQRYQWTAGVFGLPTPTVAATGVPPGLVFDPATRRIMGTPSAAGTYRVTVTAHNGIGSNSDAVAIVTITVAGP